MGSQVPDDIEGADQATLVALSTQPLGDGLRLDIAKRLDDQVLSRQIIAAIAHDGVEPGRRVREEALQLLDSQTLYSRYAMTDANRLVRLVCVEGLQSQTLLAEVARRDPDVEVRLRAVERLTDQAALADAAEHDGSLDVRVAATGKLDDALAAQRALIGVVQCYLDAPLLQPRLPAVLAIERVDDKVFLRRVVKQHRDDEPLVRAVKARLRALRWRPRRQPAGR